MSESGGFLVLMGSECVSDGSIRGLAAVRGRRGPAGRGGRGGRFPAARAQRGNAHPPTRLLLGLNDGH